MQILSKQKIKIGDVVIEPNKITTLPNAAKEDHYFKLCLKSNYFQIIEEQPKEEVKEEEVKTKKTKKEA